MARMNASGAFRSLTTLKALRETYQSSIAKGHARGRDGLSPVAFEKELSREISVLSRKLRAGTYAFTPYRQILSSKGAHKAPRIISVPTVRDRIAMKVLAQTLARVYPDSRGRIPQLHVQAILASIATSSLDAFVKVDIVNFYPSIPHGKLLERLGQRIRSKTVMHMLSCAISTPTLADGKSPPSSSNERGVPQGLAVSNVMAEIYMQAVDERIRELGDLRYFRFVDDILVLCRGSDVDHIEHSINEILKAEGLEQHPRGASGEKSASGLISAGFGYLGYQFAVRGVSVGERSEERRVGKECPV